MKRDTLKDHSQSGIAATQVVLVLGALIVVLGIEMLALGLSETLLAAGSVDSAKAYRMAEAGARDALQRIVRNKAYSCATADCYAIDFETNGCSAGSACAKVQVSTGIGSGGNPKVITSKGEVKNKTRTVQVNVVFDGSMNGEIASTTWTELTN